MRERGGEADQGEGGAKTSQIALKPPSPRLDAARRTGMHLEELSLTLRVAAHLPPDDDDDDDTILWRKANWMNYLMKEKLK